MSVLTALSLSLNNLLTKKGRTILTSFAGSIGIIGIALILSLSNGFDKQIEKSKKNGTLSHPFFGGGRGDLAPFDGRCAFDIFEDLLRRARKEQVRGRISSARGGGLRAAPRADDTLYQGDQRDGAQGRFDHLV